MGKIEIIKIFNKRKKAFVKEYKNLSKDFSEKNIHNLRVAYRRLKSVYYVLEIYGFKVDKILRKDVKEIFKILGEMRDYQVNINLLKNLYFIKEVPNEIEEKILLEIEKDGIKLRKRIRRNKKEIIKLLKKEEKRIKKHFKRTSEKEAAKIIINMYHQLNENVIKKKIQLSEDIQTYHDLRLSVKKLRYFLENFSLIEEISGEKIGELKNMQELLGDINDLDVLKNTLKNLEIFPDEKIMVFLETRLQNKVKEFKIVF